jgi:DNA-binding winged helix-turn-helix (wHTH) protein
MRYTFGRCRLDTSSREFVRHGEAVHLSPKAYDLLCLLLTHRPRVLSKAELMQALWPDTFVVEANLPVIVGELRNAFGDKSAATSPIKTHHGVGYSFNAHVTEKRSDADLAADARLFLKVGDRRLALTAGENVVGRDADCDVVITDVSVSRRHARINVSESGITVIDLGSKNKTKVKDAVVGGDPVTVRDGDEMMFGQVRALVYVVPERDPASTMSL